MKTTPVFLALLMLAAAARAQEFDTKEFLRKAKEGGTDTPSVKATPLATSKPIVAPTQSLRDSFFGPAKAVLLKKGGPSEDPRCLILSFIAEHSQYAKLDDAGYEAKVDETINGTEMYFVDFSCRDALKKPNSVAVAVPLSSKKAVGKICGVDFPDTDKDLMLLWASVNGANVNLPRHSAGPAISAHEVMHLLLKNLDPSKTIPNGGSVHHGLTNYLRWGGGDPATAWKPANPDKCKSGSAGAGTQSLSTGLNTAGAGASGEEPATSEEALDDVLGVGE